jgi:hypothetical protein
MMMAEGGERVAEGGRRGEAGWSGEARAQREQEGALAELAGASEG